MKITHLAVVGIAAWLCLGTDAFGQRGGRMGGGGGGGGCQQQSSSSTTGTTTATTATTSLSPNQAIMAQQAYLRQLQMQNLMQQEMIRQLQMQQQLQNAQRMMAMQQAQQQTASKTANSDLSDTTQTLKPARTIKNSSKSKKGNSTQMVSK